MFSYESTSVKAYITHDCYLEAQSESCLAPLPPQAGCCRRVIRFIRKTMTISERHPKTKAYFRSKSAIMSERRRHVQNNPYIIHPFSDFTNCTDYTRAMVYLLAFILEPFTIAFSRNAIGGMSLIRHIIDALVCVFMVLQFWTGYEDSATKSIVLTPSKIAKRYVATYFFFDFIATCQLPPILEALDYSAYVVSIASLTVYFRLARLPKMVEHQKLYFSLLGVSDIIYKLVAVIMQITLVIHWWACMLFHIPKIIYLGSELEDTTSWLFVAKIQWGIDVPVSTCYIECLFSTMCKFFGAGVGIYMPRNRTDLILHSLILFTGLIYNGIAIAVMFDIIIAMRTSEHLYDEILIQLRDYANQKQLPTHVGRRLLTYYKSRFNRRYFKEASILSTLSEHLRHEIFLYRCRILIEKTPVFQGASRSSVGALIANLQTQVFLPGDVIAAANTRSENIYFIVYGTVAVVDWEGLEVRHIIDGNYFGGEEVLLSETGKMRYCNYIALEVCEIYVLANECIDMLKREYPTLMEKFRLRAVENVRYYIRLRKERGSVTKEHLFKKVTSQNPRQASF